MSSPPGAWSRAIRLADLKGDGPHAVSAGGVDLVVIKTPAGLRAYEGRCPHQGALLGEGELEGGQLVCRNHRWRFDVEGGRRVGGDECLKACPIAEEGGEVFVDVRELAARRVRAKARPMAELPGPRGLPLIGNLHELEPTRLHQVLEGWAARHGGIFRFRFGPRDVVAVADPMLIEEVLRGRPGSYRRLGTVEPVFAEMGTSGVFSAEGDAWRAQRRLVIEVMSARNLRAFFPTLMAVVERLRRRLAAHAAAGREVDVADDFRRFTIDVTTQLVFGREVRALERDDDPIRRLFEPVLPAISRRLNAVVPYWRFVRLPADRALDRALGELKAWIRTLIAETRDAGGGAPANFLSAMIAARDEAGRPFTDDVIAGNAIQMLLAGEDTTANTLAWAVHLLAAAPSAAAALRIEADHLAVESLDDAGRLAYAGAVANETMRLRPVAPLIFNEAVEDVALGGWAIPRGTPVFTVMRPGGLDPHRFVDPSAFRPERWLDDGGAGPHEPRAHMPFGSGPRICPGRSLALLEMRIVLRMLAAQFDFCRAGAGDVREVFSFTMVPKGLRVRIRDRSAPAARAAD